MTWLRYRWLNLAARTAQSSSQTTKLLVYYILGHLLEPQNSLEMVSNVNVSSLVIYSVCLRVWKLLGIECSPTLYTIMVSLAITLEISFSHNKAVTVYKWNHHLFMDVDMRYFSYASLVCYRCLQGLSSLGLRRVFTETGRWINIWFIFGDLEEHNTSVMYCTGFLILGWLSGKLTGWLCSWVP